MNKLLISFSLLFYISVSAAKEIYVYPSKISLDLECKLSEKLLNEVKDKYIASDWESYSDLGHRIMNKATPIPVDLNSDGVCEIYLPVPEDYDDSVFNYTIVFALINGEYKEAGVVSYGPNVWWYGELINDYPRIFVETFTGHKTNPIYVTDVYYFNGEKYTLEFDSEYSHGYFSDLGLRAYQNKDYQQAEKWYLNAYRMRNKVSVTDANNLALTYIRQGRCNEAVKLLTPHVEDDSVTKAKEIESAKFNLALCEPSE